MKLLFLAAANSVHSWRWVEYFADRGHEVHWISLVPFARVAGKGIHTHEVRSYPVGPLSLVAAARTTRRIARAIRPDVFHVHSVGAYGAVAWLSGVRPMVATPWGSDVLIAARTPIKRWLVSSVLRTADLLTCDAQHMRDAMMELGAHQAKIRVIYFGTDVERFRPSVNGNQPPEFFPQDASVIVLSTRNLHPIYDVGTLIRASPLVLQHAPDVRFVIVGQGEESEPLAKLASTLGVADRVFFVGAIGAERIPHVVRSADIYVSTSLSDAGLAASTAEAMASGLPVVVTNSAENHLWVEEGQGGFVVPVRDAATLAAKIVQLANDPTLRRRFGEHNREVIVRRNNYLVEMEKVAAAYEQVASTHS